MKSFESSAHCLEAPWALQEPSGLDSGQARILPVFVRGPCSQVLRIAIMSAFLDLTIGAM